MEVGEREVILVDDDEDDDIKIEIQVKPINDLTVSEALLIKHNVINSLKEEEERSKKKNIWKYIKKYKSKTNRDKKLNPEEKNSNQEFQKGVEKTNGKKKTMKPVLGNKKSRKRQSSEMIEIKKENEDFDEEQNEKLESKDSIRNITQTSPKITKRKKLKISEDDIKPQSKVHKQSLSQNEFAFSHENKQLSQLYNNSNCNGFDPKILSHNKEESDEIHFENNGELLSLLLKKIIAEVTKMQLDLENRHSKDEKPNEKLLTLEECNILEEFCKLEAVQGKVFVRLLCRVKEWYRVSTIKFKDVNVPLNEIFDALHAKNFVDKCIEKDSLINQLNLLSKPEIQELCKLFLVSAKYSHSSSKSHLVKLLLHNSQTQKNVFHMFKTGTNSCSLISKLQSEVSKRVGPCIRLSEIAKAAFHKLILLFSFPHYYDEEEKRLRHQLYMCLSVHKQFIKYPKYQVSPTLVFRTWEDFNHYAASLEQKNKFLVAKNSKKFDEVASISQNVKEEFKKLLINEEYIQRYNSLEPYLKRFSGGHVYAKILTLFCNTNKRNSDTKEIIKVAQMLLAQNLFLSSKRGKWYEILSMAFENIKDNKSAAELLIKSQSDPYVDDVQKLVLQQRGQTILKKKTCSIEVYLREMLDDVCTISVQEPPSIEISGKALEGNKSGFKVVYVEKTASGKLYTSVEERALLHYKMNGFSKGCHVEGYIIHSLYVLLFYDIIYGLSPAGVFQSPYQEAPLDFFTEYFYLNRKIAIDLRLEEMMKWTDEEGEIRLTTAYYELLETESLMTWKENFTSELFCEIMKCITLPMLANICKRLVTNFRVFRSGFPDLTLWNPETKKCKFVEVKSPNDKLSAGQRIWLQFLRHIGMDCEVCNVKNVSRKLSHQE